MPLLSRRVRRKSPCFARRKPCSARHCGAFDHIRGGLTPPRAPPCLSRCGLGLFAGLLILCEISPGQTVPGRFLITIYNMYRFTVSAQALTPGPSSAYISAIKDAQLVYSLMQWLNSVRGAISGTLSPSGTSFVTLPFSSTP